MAEIMRGLMNWAWSLITGAQELVTWLFTPISLLGWEIAPIYLIGIATLTVGVIRAIIGII